MWIDHATKTHFFVSYVACSQSIHNIFIYKIPRNDEGRFNIKLYNAQPEKNDLKSDKNTLKYNLVDGIYVLICKPINFLIPHNREL